MSKISDCIDEIKLRLAAKLPTHSKLAHSSVIAANSEPSLQKGYALAIGSATNTELQLGCNMSMLRTITIVITRHAVALDLNLEAKQDFDKLLLEDVATVIKDFEKEPWIEEQASSFIFKGDSGIQPVFEARADYIKMELNFELTYFEAI